MDRLTQLNWDDLKFFLAIARAGSARKAAHGTGANHATVARRLTLLEEMLDARLFDRSQQGLTLTRMGETLLPYAERMERELAGASRAISGQDTRIAGTVHVSIPYFMVNTPVGEHIAAFTADNPEIQIALQASNQLASLQRHEVDVSIRYAKEVAGDMVGTVLAHCQKAFYCAPGLAKRMADNGGQGIDILGWNEPHDESDAEWIKASPFPNANLRHRLAEGASQTLFATAGLGLCILPCFYGDAQPGLIRAPYHDPIPDRTLWLLYHKDIRDTARVGLFIDYMTTNIRKHSSDF
ncbi:hypothetical protein ACMU_08190 [Actibacterium mucosum KCTC 23349]|uniref:HTH lysR-type domain-containing protein n=1 Tax=Actibacterium mucosum KCTC 23349 TaxID=1454373 RepID=A0A037ZQ19_9RHOB|nr:LysR family transcriptional regulator [Actibacterium mucosum]KAJ56907.1 hypothetical protein ACMU_08190 [Actibacterium mucosum KCTC 23349]